MTSARMRAKRVKLMRAGIIISLKADAVCQLVSFGALRNGRGLTRNGHPASGFQVIQEAERVVNFGQSIFALAWPTGSIQRLDLTDFTRLSEHHNCTARCYTQNEVVWLTRCVPGGSRALACISAAVPPFELRTYCSAVVTLELRRLLGARVAILPIFTEMRDKVKIHCGFCQPRMRNRNKVYVVLSPLPHSSRLFKDRYLGDRR